MHLLPEKVMVRQFIMNNIPMIIMAAGVSSRMKDSSVPKAISQNLINQSNDRVKGFIHNTSKKQRYVFIRYVLHDADLEPLAMDSHTISILKPGEKSKIDFIFHEKSKKPLNVIGSLIRIRNFDVK